VIHKAVKLKMCHKMTQTNFARGIKTFDNHIQCHKRGLKFIQQKQIMMPLSILGVTGRLSRSSSIGTVGEM
jgi:hypothetical protein